MHAQPGWGSLLAWPALLSCPVPARVVLCTVLLSILAHPYAPLGGWQASRHLPSAASRIVAGIGDLWASGVVVFRCVMCLPVWSSFPLIPLLVTCVCVGICPRRVHLREIVSVCGDVWCVWMCRSGVWLLTRMWLFHCGVLSFVGFASKSGQLCHGIARGASSTNAK